MANTHQDFVTGFLGGIGDVLKQRRDEQTRQADIEHQAQFEGLKALLSSGQIDPADFPFAVHSMLGTKPGQKPKGQKPGQPDPHEMITKVLTQAHQGAQQEASAAPGANDPTFDEGNSTPDAAAPPAGAPAGPAPSPLAAPTQAPAAAPQRSMFGVPILSTEDVAARKQKLEGDAIMAKVDMARNRIYPALKAADPNATLDDAFAIAGVDMRRAGRAASGTGTLGNSRFIFGESGGQPVSASWDPKTKSLVDANTGQPFPADKPFLRASLSTSKPLSTIAETVARENFYANAQAAIDDGFPLADAVNENIKKQRGAGAQGTAEAQQAADAKKLLTPTEAEALQTSYGITKGQAAELQRVPLNPSQVQAATASYQMDSDIAKAKILFDKVWPRDASPELRRAKLIALQRNQNPDYVDLLATLKRMPLRLAVMTQGSRPSDIDQELFQTSFPTTTATDWNLTTPSSYESGVRLLQAADQLTSTARQSIGLVPLSERGSKTPSGAASKTPDGKVPAPPGFHYDAKGTLVWD